MYLCVCLCVCACVCAEPFGETTGPEIVSHRPKDARLSFEKFGQMMTSWRPFY